MHPAVPNRKLQVVFQPSPSGIASTALANSIAPLLELTLAQAHVEGVYVYRLLQEEASLHLAVWSGLEPTRIVHYQVQVAGQAAAWHCELASPAILDRAAWRDWVSGPAGIPPPSVRGCGFYSAAGWRRTGWDCQLLPPPGRRIHAHRKCIPAQPQLAPGQSADRLMDAEPPAIGVGESLTATRRPQGFGAGERAATSAQPMD